ncbi:MAG: hypothetical protein KKB37_07130, partial [Alphaproteobacteria bacterium]|nr:hypothetical protein [Alphaproteobacteria bacterium]
ALAGMLDMTCDRLAPALSAARDLGLLAAQNPRQGSEQPLIFADPRLQRFLYDMVPAKERLRLHRKMAAVLRRDGGHVPTIAAAIATHHAAARDTHQSKRWLSKAAWLAIANGDAAQAVKHLRDALRLDGVGSATRALNRGLLQLLGVQLAITRGNGSDEVFETYQRSIAAADDAASLVGTQAFRSLWLAQSCHLVKGEVQAALTVGNALLVQLNRQAGRNGASAAPSLLGMRILAHRMQGLALLLGGQLEKSLAHYGQVFEHYDEAHHAVLRFAYGSDQRVLAFAHTAWLHTIAGHPGAAQASARRAQRAAEKLDHAHTTVHTISVLALAALTAGARKEAALAASHARAIAAEYDYPYWLAWAEVILAGVEAASQPRAGLERLQHAANAYRVTGARQLLPVAQYLMSDAALRSGRAESALCDCETGLAIAQHNGCILYLPSLLLQRAKCLVALARLEEADAALEAAYCCATGMKARLFVNAITRSGCRHGRDQRQILWQRRYHEWI